MNKFKVHSAILTDSPFGPYWTLSVQVRMGIAEKNVHVDLHGMEDRETVEGLILSNFGTPRPADVAGLTQVLDDLFTTCGHGVEIRKVSRENAEIFTTRQRNRKFMEMLRDSELRDLISYEDALGVLKTYYLAEPVMES